VSLRSEGSSPKGQILKVSSNLDGMSRVVVDNGPFSVLTLHCRTEDLGDLLEADVAALRNHLMTRKPGHFRIKPGK